ncbi:MAG: PQQ-binding-like beta-propeller repeat protein [Phaeodactylibacter sp.]|uniref:outer membrane protein assembly factor BamB family protein n=1 Tax=Phaeodactylibacter sp. TaxID=1940289 RepID=UPI0032F052E4
MKITNPLIVILLLIPLFSTCRKENAEDLVDIQVQVRIPTAYNLQPRQGLLYQGAYLVWARSLSGDRLLVAFDLETQLRLWEMDCDDLIGWGQPMLLEGDYLITDRKEIGLSVINLVNQEVLVSYRYDNTPGFTSSTPPTIYDGKIYKGVYNRGNGLSTVLSIDMEDGAVHPEFQWLNNLEYNRQLSSPLVYEAEGGALNLLMAMLLGNPDPDMFFDQKILLINGNNNYSVNWVDTLIPAQARTAIDFLPVIIEDDLYAAYEDKVVSYDIQTGERNWAQEIEKNNLLKLIAREGELYLNTYSEFSKLNKATGEMVWTQTLFTAPTLSADFSVHEDYLMYTSFDFGRLILLNPNSGTYYEGDYSEVEQIGSPLVYNNGELFVTHTIEDEVIGFVVE